MKRFLVIGVLAAVLAVPAGIALARATAGPVANGLPVATAGAFSTPEDTLQTYFGSAIRADYERTYSCYYQRYRDAVAVDEFVSHREQAARLESWRIDSISQKGDTATASVTLTFARKDASATSRATTVQEDLVREADGWRIRVW